MKLGKLGLFLFNVLVIVMAVVMIVQNFGLWKDGEISFIQFLLYSSAFILFWRITKARKVQSLLGRLFGWDPLAGIAIDKRRFNAWYGALAARREQREAERNEAARARHEALNQAARARYDALNKAAWHESQARRYAGTRDGNWHANQAKQYRNQAR